MVAMASGVRLSNRYIQERHKPRLNLPLPPSPVPTKVSERTTRHCGCCHCCKSRGPHQYPDVVSARAKQILRDDCQRGSNHSKPCEEQQESDDISPAPG